MNLIAARIVLLLAGFALWALTSALPLSEVVREGWDRPVYFQIGLPIVLAVQLVVAIVSDERMTVAPLVTLLGHVVAMVFVHPEGTGLGLLPLAVIFVGVPLYVVLLAAAFIGRMIRRLTGLAS